MAHLRPSPINPAPVVLPEFVTMEIKVRVIRLNQQPGNAVYQTGSPSYQPVSVYLDINGVQVPAKVLYPPDDPRVELSDIGNSCLRATATVEWGLDGIHVAQLNLITAHGKVTLEINAI